MKFIFILFSYLLSMACTNAPKPNSDPSLKDKNTIIEVVQLNNMRFRAESFFGERQNLTFEEVIAPPIYDEWAQEAISKVNELLPSDARLPRVKLKLIFSAFITSSNGKTQQVPISIIESYQEPKTASIRLGMEELKNNKQSFQLTVAHEYAHLVFENASRSAGATSDTDENISFWPKPVYEGVADLMMGLAMNSDLTASSESWASYNLNEFKTLAGARKSKSDIIHRARTAFLKMKLLPTYKIYEDWLSKVDG